MTRDARAAVYSGAMRDFIQPLVVVWFLASIIGVYAFAVHQAIYNPHVHEPLTTGSIRQRAGFFALFFLFATPFAWVAVAAAGGLVIGVIDLMVP